MMRTLVPTLGALLLIASQGMCARTLKSPAPAAAPPTKLRTGKLFRKRKVLCGGGLPQQSVRVCASTPCVARGCVEVWWAGVGAVWECANWCVGIRNGS